MSFLPFEFQRDEVYVIDCFREPWTYERRVWGWIVRLYMNTDDLMQRYRVKP